MKIQVTRTTRTSTEKIAFKTYLIVVYEYNISHYVDFQINS